MSKADRIRELEEKLIQSRRIDIEKKFVISEFLTWLLFITKKKGGQIKLKDFGVVSIRVSDNIHVFNPLGISKESYYSKGRTIDSPALARELFDGKKVISERIQVSIKNETFSVIVNNQLQFINFARDNRPFERDKKIITNVNRIYNFILLFESILLNFIKKRVNSDWNKKFLPEIMLWIKENYIQTLPQENL